MATLKKKSIKKPKQTKKHIQPIDHVTWVHVNDLTANHYNPNVCVGLEFDLLQLSLLKQGWIQPILVSKDMIIIDGFHRWSTVKKSKEVYAMTGGKVPVAVLDLTEKDRQLLTVRINRAKGTHVAFKMHDLIKELIDVHGLSPAELATEIGGTVEEVNTLMIENVFVAKDVQNTAYSKSWSPQK